MWRRSTHQLVGHSAAKTFATSTEAELSINAGVVVQLPFSWMEGWKDDEFWDGI